MRMWKGRTPAIGRGADTAAAWPGKPSWAATAAPAASPRKRRRPVVPRPMSSIAPIPNSFSRSAVPRVRGHRRTAHRVVEPGKLPCRPGCFTGATGRFAREPWRWRSFRDAAEGVIGMAKILFVVSGATYLTLKDGTRYATGYWAEE